MDINPYQSPQTEDLDYRGPDADDMVGDHLARRGTRLAATIIDGILLTLLNVPMQYVMQIGFFQPPIANADINPLNPFSYYAAIGLTKTLVAFLAPLAMYFLLNGYLLKSNGQTIGKRLFQIKIVRKNGAPAEFHRLVFHRYLLMTLISMIPFLGMLIVGFVDPLLIFRSSRSCLHDDIADTMVVKA